MHLRPTVQESIRILEKRCISRGEEENPSTQPEKKSEKLFEKSLNLPMPEKGSSSNVRGGIQPITAADTHSPRDAFVTSRDHVTCDWTRGQFLEASDKSEEGGQSGD